MGSQEGWRNKDLSLQEKRGAQEAVWGEGHPILSCPQGHLPIPLDSAPAGALLTKPSSSRRQDGRASAPLVGAFRAGFLAFECGAKFLMVI